MKRNNCIVIFKQIDAEVSFCKLKLQNKRNLIQTGWDWWLKDGSQISISGWQEGVGGNEKKQNN